MDLPLIALDGDGLLWEHEGQEYELDVFQIEHPAPPRSDGIKAFLWGRMPHDVEVPRYESMEAALSAAVSEFLTDTDVIRSLRTSGRARLKAELFDGLFNIYEDVGTSASPDWKPKYLGIEPDGVIASIGADMDAGWYQALFRKHLESSMLRVAGDPVGLIAFGRNAVYRDADGIILADRKAVIRESGCGPKNWRRAAGLVLDHEAHRWSSFLKGEVYGYDLYVQGLELARNDSGIYGGTLVQSGLADLVGHGLTDAVAAGTFKYRQP